MTTLEEYKLLAESLDKELDAALELLQKIRDEHPSYYLIDKMIDDLLGDDDES